MEEIQDQIAPVPVENPADELAESTKTEESSRHSSDVETLVEDLAESTTTETNSGNGSDVESHVPQNNNAPLNPSPLAEAQAGISPVGADQVDEAQADITQADGPADAERESWILFVIALVQTSMNLNTSLYSSGITDMSHEFNIPKLAARSGAMIFLITYAVGCELWAPCSEDIGRKVTLQLSMLLVNFFAIPVALAPNLLWVLVCRALGGLSTAGGSVTLGMIADMYEADDQQHAVAFVIFSSVFGSVLGPIIGGFVELLPPHKIWRWCTGIQIIFGFAVQLLHLVTVPETRINVVMDSIARKRRKTGLDPNIYGPGELSRLRRPRECCDRVKDFFRAWHILFTEKIVFFLSLLSGLSDAVIFMQIQSMSLIYKKWHFNSWQNGLAFIPFAVGYLIAWACFILSFQLGQRARDEHPLDDYAQFEMRLKLMIFLEFLLPVGLALFAATTSGSENQGHWIFSMVGTVMIGIANYAIYMGTTDYLVAAYGPWAASATGGNSMARDMLAGLVTPIAIPFYTRIGKEDEFGQASFILCMASVVVVAFAIWTYSHGHKYRRKSPIAMSMASRRSQHQNLPPNLDGVIVPGSQAAEVAQLDQPAHLPKPANINEYIQAIYDGSYELENVNPSRPGRSAPHGSYMASVRAASRRQSRQVKRNPSLRESVGNHWEEAPDIAV
ncbi:major facilitator superfamily domain-containing protein [Xylaria arbuscula]|nr:major facilitator superfamily domain-containing protein [Xylaria arbuscula]